MAIQAIILAGTDEEWPPELFDSVYDDEPVNGRESVAAKRRFEFNANRKFQKAVNRG